ncbi:hypothetical protein ABHA01_11300 [Clostridium paraputrificum]|uniref:hypothetical protein n=1 Tax=Clostridium paraputrificum TaxID=29363 RepID=UPI00325A4C68
MFFRTNSKLKIDNDNYRVIGATTFSNMNAKEKWAEYILENIDDNKVCWLEVNEDYKEYILFQNREFFREIDPNELFSNNFIVYSSGTAEVVVNTGLSNRSNGDEIKYRRFQNEFIGKVIEYKGWNDEEEYSIGEFINENRISAPTNSVKTDFDGLKDEDGMYDNIYELNVVENSDEERFRKTSYSIFAICLVLILIFLGIKFIGVMRGETLDNVVRFDESFTYKTSLSDGDNLANVYRSSETLEKTKNIILNKASVNYKTKDIETGTMVLMNDKEFCIIYTGTLGEVLIQVSSRKYDINAGIYDSSKEVSNYYETIYYTVVNEE